MARLTAEDIQMMQNDPEFAAAMEAQGGNERAGVREGPTPEQLAEMEGFRQPGVDYRNMPVEPTAPLPPEDMQKFMPEGTDYNDYAGPSPEEVRYNEYMRMKEQEQLQMAAEAQKQAEVEAIGKEAINSLTPEELQQLQANQAQQQLSNKLLEERKTKSALAGTAGEFAQKLLQGN